MKKIAFLLSIVALLCSNVSNGQDFKPVANDFDVELMFVPFSNNPVQLDNFRGRYFFADDLALRIGVNVAVHAEKSEPVNETNSNVTDEEKMSSTQLGFLPGIEIHLGDFQRVSPYIGAEVGIVTKSARYEYTDNATSTTMEIKGAWSDNGSNRGFTSFRINAVTGVDYYFVRRMYLGAELGYGFSSTAWKKIEATSGSNTITIENKSTSTDVGFGVISAIRLGYSF